MDFVKLTYEAPQFLKLLTDPAVSKTTVLMLRCHSIDDGRYLLADYSVRCDVPEYQKYRALGIFFTLLYPIGIPLFFGLVLAKNRRNLTPDWWPDNIAYHETKAFAAYRALKGNEWADRQEWHDGVWVPRVKKWHKFETRFGFLFNAYRHKYYWFESVMSVYKLAQTTGVVFISGADGPGGTKLKILYTMFMATCLIALVAFLQPYKEADVLSVETMVNLELLFVLFAALYLQQQPAAATSLVVGLFLIMLLLTPLVLTIWLLARSVRQEMGRSRSNSKASSANSNGGLSSLGSVGSTMSQLLQTTNSPQLASNDSGGKRAFASWRSAKKHAGMDDHGGMKKAAARAKSKAKAAKAQAERAEEEKAEQEQEHNQQKRLARNISQGWKSIPSSQSNLADASVGPETGKAGAGKAQKGDISKREKWAAMYDSFKDDGGEGDADSSLHQPAGDSNVSVV
eukprot:g5344.t1